MVLRTSQCLCCDGVLLAAALSSVLAIACRPRGQGSPSELGSHPLGEVEQVIAPLTARAPGAGTSSSRVAVSKRDRADGSSHFGVPGGVRIAPGVQVVALLPHPEQTASAALVDADALRARATMIAHVADSSASGARPGRGTTLREGSEGRPASVTTMSSSAAGPSTVHRKPKRQKRVHLTVPASASKAPSRPEPFATERPSEVTAGNPPESFVTPTGSSAPAAPPAPAFDAGG